MLMNTPISTSPQGSFCDMMPSMMKDISTGLGAENLEVTFSPLSRWVSCPLMPGSSRYLMCPPSSTRYLPGGTAPRVGPAQALAAVVFAGGELDLGIVATGEDRPRVVQLEDHEPEQERAGKRADQDRDLLPRGRGPQDGAGLEVLRSGAAVGDGDAGDGGDRERRDLVGRAHPAQREEDERGDDQRRDRH